MQIEIEMGEESVVVCLTFQFPSRSLLTADGFRLMVVWHQSPRGRCTQGVRLARESLPDLRFRCLAQTLTKASYTVQNADTL